MVPGTEANSYELQNVGASRRICGNQRVERISGHPAERGTGAGNGTWNSAECQRAVEETCHRRLVGRIEHRWRRAPPPTSRNTQPERREGVVTDRLVRQR